MSTQIEMEKCSGFVRIPSIRLICLTCGRYDVEIDKNTDEYKIAQDLGVEAILATQPHDPLTEKELKDAGSKAAEETFLQSEFQATKLFPQWEVNGTYARQIYEGAFLQRYGEMHSTVQKFLASTQAETFKVWAALIFGNHPKKKLDRRLAIAELTAQLLPYGLKNLLRKQNFPLEGSIEIIPLTNQ